MTDYELIKQRLINDYSCYHSGKTLIVDDFNYDVLDTGMKLLKVTKICFYCGEEYIEFVWEN